MRNPARGTIHPTSEEAGILYPLTPFFIIDSGASSSIAKTYDILV